VKESSSVSGHADAINFILRLEAIWEYYKALAIAECEDCWIVGGRIYRKVGA
jgi:hypothetical protein